MSTVYFYCVLCGTKLQISSDSRYDLTRCPCCARYVPIPRPVKRPGSLPRYAYVFPPEVLELLVKFKCTACGTVLHVDARCEGRQVVCTRCHVRTGIPRWSTAPEGAFPADSGEKSRTRAPRLPARTAAPTLSVEEIDYLRGANSRQPEAAA